MGSRFRRFFVLSTSISVVFFFTLLAGCGSSNNSGSSGSGSGGTGSSNPGSGGSGSGSGSSNSVAYAYTSNGTSILAYAVNTDGSLSTVSGSPYAIGTHIEQLSAQGALVTNGANLYAIVAGNIPTSLIIAPINKSNGSLSQATTSSAITGDPNTSDYADLLALDSTGSSLYAVVGLSDQDAGVNVFGVGSGTSANHVQYLGGGAIAGSALVFTSDNHYAYNWNCSARVTGVNGYTRASDGTLTSLPALQAQPPVTSPGVGYCPAGLAASANGYLAIAWIPFGYASTVQVGNQIAVGIYKINADGTISLVPNSGVTTAISATAALGFDPSGSYLAVAGTGGVQIYMLNSAATLTPVGTAQDASVNFASVAWDKSNHVFATSSSQLYVFSSNSGALTPASGSPYGGGAALTVLPLQ